MTDRETIFDYRMRQTEETLAEAVKMQESGFSPRAIVNRSYYAMFYKNAEGGLGGCCLLTF